MEKGEICKKNYTEISEVLSIFQQLSDEDKLKIIGIAENMLLSQEKNNKKIVGAK